MKRLLLTVALLAAWSASAQPFLRNSITTNDLSTNLVWNPGGKALNIRGASPELDFWNTSGATDLKRYAISASSSQLRFHLTTDNGGSTALLGYWATNGDWVVQGGMSLSGTTNRLTDDGTQLLRNGQAVGLTVSQNGTNGAPAVNFTNSATVTWARSGSNWTATASGGSSAQSFNTVTFSSGTNLTALDCSLGDNSSASYSLSLTNNAFFGTPSSVPSTVKSFAIWFKQDSTGTRTVGWTNGSFKFPGGIVPVVDTNANAVTLVTFATGPFTNSLLNYVGITPQIQ